MFLHSGASFHGHEFSNKPAQAGSPSNPRNSFLRSSRPSPAHRAITFPTGPPLVADLNHVPDVKKRVSFPGCGARSPDSVSVTEEPDAQFATSQGEVMSGDESSITTGIEEVPASCPRHTCRTKDQRRTTYILAHPPPRLRTKHRLLHIRPNLVLQVQQVLAGVRPEPVIDVYPSSAIAGSIIAPLLKRFPRIAPIKNELSIHDVMLVRSEDYTASTAGSEGDDDEDSLMARDLIAILSPSSQEDRTEIVMADGTVWVATTRTIGATYSYDFTATDAMGKMSTARWVRKRAIASSLPGTPTSPVSDPFKQQFSDCKFTFSFIDPGSRRHPILATLTSTSLGISEAYTAIGPSANHDGGESPTQCLEPWQRAFISVSAVWVALRQGWAPNFRPEDLMPSRASNASQHTERGIHGRKRSQSVNTTSTASNSSVSEMGGRRKYPVGLRQNEMQCPNNLPRRATSTGAAFMQKRRETQTETDDRHSDDSRITKLNRRAFSGDWNVGLLKGGGENTLAEIVMESPRGSLEDAPQDERSMSSSSPSSIARRRVVSAYATVRPLSASPDYTDVTTLDKEPTSVTGKMPEKGEREDTNSKRRRRKWKSMTKWFRKLSRR